MDACGHAAAQVKVIPNVVGLIGERDKSLLGGMEGEIVSPQHPTDKVPVLGLWPIERLLLRMLHLLVRKDLSSWLLPGKLQDPERV